MRIRFRARRMALPPVTRKVRNSPLSPALAMADFLDAVARGVHLGNSLRGSVGIALNDASVVVKPYLQSLALHCRIGAPLEDLVNDNTTNDLPPDIAFGMYALVASNAGGTGTGHALQRASWVLRERHSVNEERRTQSAQALFSARVLSWLPVAFGATMLGTNSGVRHVVFATPAGLACLVVGICLNLAGRRWMMWLAKSKPDTGLSASFVEFVDLLVVMLKSGRTTHQSFIAMATFGPPRVREVLTQLLHRHAIGGRFVEALPVLHSYFGPSAIGVTSTLAAAERDGLPLAPMLERLAYEAHVERRRTAQIDAAKLPVRLVFPLVLCVLPSFVALSIVPILIGALSSLTTGPISL